MTAAAQYGATVEALVVYLQAWQLIPEDRLAELMGDVFGVEVATSTIAAMGQRKAQELTGLAEHIEQQVKQAAVKHLDETGYRIAGSAAVAACRLHLATDVLPHVGQARRDAGWRAGDHRP